MGQAIQSTAVGYNQRKLLNNVLRMNSKLLLQEKCSCGSSCWRHKMPGAGPRTQWDCEWMFFTHGKNLLVSVCFISATGSRQTKIMCLDTCYFCPASLTERHRKPPKKSSTYERFNTRHTGRTTKADVRHSGRKAHRRITCGIVIRVDLFRNRTVLG